MSKGDVFENDWLKLIFQAVAIANIADNAAAAPLTNLYVSLHTGSVTDAGDQTTSECTYGDYARVAVARTAGGWEVINNSVSPVAEIAFPVAASGTNSVTHFAVGTAATMAGKVLYHGPITPTISVTTGVQPKLTVASAITED